MWNYQLPSFFPLMPLPPYQWNAYHHISPFQQFLPHFKPFLPKMEEKQNFFDHCEPDVKFNKLESQDTKEKALQLQDLEETRKKTRVTRISKKQTRNQTSSRKLKEVHIQRKKQKKDRNLPSNICRFFICYLYQHTCPEKAFGVTSHEGSIRLKSCIQEVKRHIKLKQTYIRPRIIEGMCLGQLIGKENSQTFRAVFSLFLKVELRMIVSMMGKLRKKEKVSYFKIANKFLKSMRLLC